jgi:hypothetical protein
MVSQILPGPQKGFGTSPVRQFFGYAQPSCLDIMEHGVCGICEPENIAQMLVDSDWAILGRCFLLNIRYPRPLASRAWKLQSQSTETGQSRNFSTHLEHIYGSTGFSELLPENWTGGTSGFQALYISKGGMAGIPGMRKTCDAAFKAGAAFEAAKGEKMIAHMAKRVEYLDIPGTLIL